MDRNGMVAVGGMALISRYLFRSDRDAVLRELLNSRCMKRSDP